ncbi:MAG TPA: DUF4271 domain-containing protein [Bacteroidales bacterium]|nr:DUF4271 domain-containing protein [Bacteroidales bacterium]
MKATQQLLHTMSDSTMVSGDTVAIYQPDRVFKSETRPPDTTRNNYPFSENIHRNLTPDWILYILIGVLVVLAWIRLVFNKHIINLFDSAFNYQRAVKVYDDPGVVKTRIFLALNIIYTLSGGLFLYLAMQHYNLHPAGLTGINQFLVAAVFLAALMIGKVIVVKTTALIFNREKLFNAYLFHNFIFNKITGIVIIPFVLAIAYSKGLPRDIFIYSGFVALASVVILRITRLLMFIFKNVVLLFYLILYLCTLEILPMLVIVKLILSLA